MSTKKHLLLGLLCAAITLTLVLVFLNTSARVTLRYRIKGSAELKCYPSTLLGSSIDKHARLVKMNDSNGGFVETTVSIPLAHLARIHLVIPPETEFDLAPLSITPVGLPVIVRNIKYLYYKSHPSPSLQLTQGKGDFLTFKTKELPGDYTVRIVNDSPRVAGVVYALLCSFLLCSAILLCTNHSVRAFFSKVLGRQDIGLVILFVALLILPSFLETYVPGRRIKAPGITFDLRNLQDYPRAFTNWYRYNLPYRDEIFELYHTIVRVADIAPVKEVLPGKDDWFFSNRQIREAGEYPYADYLGANLYTEKQLAQILENLNRFDSRLQKQGIKFCVYIAPNKLTIYGDEFLLEKYKRKRVPPLTKARQVVEYIRKHSSIPVVYPEEALMEARKRAQYPLYFRTDTHWNMLGGYIGIQELLKVLMPEQAWEMKDLATFQVVESGRHRGDLLNVMEAPPVVNEPLYLLKTDPAPRFLTQDYFGCHQLDDPGPGKKRFFIIRDSFILAMLPYLRNYSSSTMLYWEFNYNIPMIEEFKPDFVVLETVERFLDRFLSLPDKTEPLGKQHIYSKVPALE